MYFEQQQNFTLFVDALTEITKAWGWRSRETATAIFKWCEMHDCNQYKPHPVKNGLNLRFFDIKN